MTEKDTLRTILDNLRNLSWSTMDAPYHGISAEQESAIYFSINKALEGTGITEQDVINGDYLELINKEDSYMTKLKMMKEFTVGFKRLSPDAIIPTKAHANDSGFDLYASEDVIIEPGETVLVPTGIAVQLPAGCEAQIRPKSGITSKTKLRVQLGTVDNGYTGEIKVIVDNISTEGCEDYGANDISGEPESYDSTRYIIEKGDKIAQLVVKYLPQVTAVEVDEIDGASTSRGEGGFGSTGVRHEKEDE